MSPAVTPRSTRPTTPTRWAGRPRCGAADPVERFDEAAHNPFAVGPYELWVERTGGVVRHHVRAKDPDGHPLPEYVTTADLAIGSGSRGRSYVCRQTGEAWQSPISWFGPGARWGLSPGFDLGTGGRRAVAAQCLFCHVNRVEPVPGALNRYRDPFPVSQAAIGCERCHGPGEVHVAERAAGPPPDRTDTSIVNPKHLSADLRSAVCAQCHLQGEWRVTRRGRELDEFRPGLPLALFATVYVRHPDIADLQKSVGQFEQIYRSRCFTASDGRFGCVSCHDPHATPPAGAADRDRYYRERCLTCHGRGGAGCAEQPAVRQQAADRLRRVPHAPCGQLQHHTRQRDGPPSGPPPGGSPRRPRRAVRWAVPLVRFPLGPAGPAAEDERDLGVALGRVAGRAAAADPRARWRWRPPRANACRRPSPVGPTTSRAGWPWARPARPAQTGKGRTGRARPPSPGSPGWWRAGRSRPRPQPRQGDTRRPWRPPPSGFG